MQFVVITTINSPTETFNRIINNNNISCLVVGDDKTPKEWSLPGVNFISVEKQETLGYSLTKYLPHSHYSRKNLGYIYAKRNGATGIIDTDDDNYPTEKWQYPVESGSFSITDDNQGFVNIYDYFSNEFCWPRGFPLDEIIPSKGKMKLKDFPDQKKPQIGIWQGLVDGDPDFDAIYRLTHELKVSNFLSKNPVILNNSCYCPINSQNTYFIDQLFPLLYLPISVAFRFTDILRGYLAEVISFHKGYYVGFCSPNVEQIRNQHSYFHDFLDEATTYQYSKKVVEIAENEVSDSDSIADNLYQIYASLVKSHIVSDQELPALDAFLNDIS